MSILQPNPRDIQRAMRELEHLDAKKASVSDFEAQLTSLFRGYGVSAPKFDAGLYLYRGRKCEMPIKLKSLTYPPPSLVTRLGRANDIGQSMFYAATARAVPFFELGVKPGDHIALSRWKTTGPMMLNHIGFSSEPSSFNESNRKIDRIYKFVEDTRAMGDLNALVHDYLAYNFARSIKDSDDYKFAFAISKKLLSSELFDGLLYPTIQMFGNADNVVLKTDTVDRLLAFVSVEYVKVKEVRGQEIDIDILDSATQADLIGTLDWSGRHLHWKLRRKGDQLTVVSKSGEWLAYDQFGNRVDPE